MKTYEKPKLIALSLSGNNMLCNTCQFDVIGDNADPLADTIKDMAEVATITELNFARGETSCAVELDIDITSYCKFAGADAGGLVVINS